MLSAPVDGLCFLLERGPCGVHNAETSGRAKGGVGDPRPAWGPGQLGGKTDLRGYTRRRPPVGRRAGSETRAQLGDLANLGEKRIYAGTQGGDLRSGEGRGRRPAPNFGRRAGSDTRAKHWEKTNSRGYTMWRPSVARRAGSETRAQHWDGPNVAETAALKGPTHDSPGHRPRCCPQVFGSPWQIIEDRRPCKPTDGLDEHTSQWSDTCLHLGSSTK